MNSNVRAFEAKNKQQGGDNMTDSEKKLWAATQLQQKSAELGRLPKKDDFDEVTRSKIKAFLGPWPRALEAAGLKESKEETKKSKKRKK